MKQIFKHKCASCGEYSFEYHEGSHTETTYQWVCDNCGIQMGMRFHDGGKQVEQTPTGKRCERTIALLRMRDNASFMFIYEGHVWGGDLGGQKYYYEAHACPTNLMRCVEIIAAGETDPHGIFEIVEEHCITGPAARSRRDVIEELTALAVEKTRMANDPSSPTGANYNNENKPLK